MTDESPKPDHRPSKLPGRIFSSRALIPAIIIVVALIGGTSATFVWAQGYDGRIAPNVWIGPVAVGGLDVEEARQLVEAAVDKYLTEGIQVTVDGKTETIPLVGLSTADGGAAFDLVVFDTNGAVATAEQIGQEGSPLRQTLRLLGALANETHLPLPATVQEESLATFIRQEFPASEQEPISADFVFTQSPNGNAWSADVTLATAGKTLDMEPLFSELDTAIQQLQSGPFVLERVHADPAVRSAEAETVVFDAIWILTHAPYTLTYDPDRFTHHEWTLDTALLTEALAPERDETGEVVVGLELDASTPVLDEIALAINRAATDARFSMTDGRVTEFIASSDGIELDREGTLQVLEGLFQSVIDRTSELNTVPIVVSTVAPDITTGEVNDLGITEVLGVGTSNYAGSPTNRVLNIANGVDHLNGLLIPPGETFSLLDALAPFTTANGYLPEKVIKGDKIEPEIGGGLCQIGTTTFRAAMNSGLPIVERRNHSLVVRYYNDPSNGNPGTDATIYDPAPDFKFLNDTGHTILFQAERNADTGDLRFTFWGTSDGRKGSYTPPTVIRWIGAGEAKTIETEDLAPGVTQCQSAFVGADTTFTYTIERPDGSLEEEVFESHYRGLPQICLVGVDPNAVEEPPAEGEPTDESNNEELEEADPDAVPILNEDTSAPEDAADEEIET